MLNKIKKIKRYFLIILFILASTALVIGIFYSRLLYLALVIDNEDKMPPLIVKLIDKVSGHQQAPVPVVLKTEETIQIPEGWTTRDIGQYFENLGKWQSEEFLEVAGFPLVDYRRDKDMPPLSDRSEKFDFLSDKPKHYGLEGFLFPDTYRIYASSTVSDVIDKMLANFDKKLTSKMRADIKAQGKSIYSIVTMASIIEKEAPIDYQKDNNRDARIISGIFWHRLKIGQALQSDATLSYILNDNEPSHSGSDLEVNSSYNTYKYRGLPPGPICNPGLLALEAAIYPIDTDYNYFLTPKGKNTVVYAETYEGHLKNKYKYLR